MRATNVTLRFLVLQAYDLREFQVAGGPRWIGTARFDLDARAPAIPDPDVHAMLRSLLEEKFQLRVHRETRPIDVFLLTAIDGGSKLRSTPVRRSGPPISTRTNAGSEGGEVKASGVRIGLLADTLRSELGRPIIDRTNLTGTFEVDLTWSPSASGRVRGGEPDGLNPANEAARQAIFAALRDQLGLKLEPATVPVEILVIDSAQNPF